MQFKSFMEALKGKQHKIDKNKNGQIDAQDFKMLRKEETEESNESFDFNRAALSKQKLQNLRSSGRKVRGASVANLMRASGLREDELDETELDQLDEVLSKDAKAGDWISDFVHSTNPKFDGKSKKERINMALGAYYSSNKKKDGISEQAPVAPVPDRKYIKGTPENKAYKATKKPINGMPTNVKEEAEQIDELSKGTLGSYVNKASKDARFSGQIAKDFEHKAQKARNPGMKDASKSLAASFKSKAWKRDDGIEKAVSRLTKEEAEQIDEKSDQARQNKTMKNLLAASKGAQVNRTLKLDPAEYGYKKAQHLNKAIGRQMMKTEATDTVTKDASGKVVSWKHEGDWKKQTAKKNPEGKVHNLAGMAMQKTKKLNQEAKDPGEYDQEGDMAKTQLRSIKYHAEELHDMLNDNDNLPEWVQSKLTLAQDYLQTVCDYMYSKNEVNEAAYAGLEKEDKPGKVKTAVVKKHENGVESETVEGWKDAKKPVKEEYDEDGNLITTPKSYSDFIAEMDFVGGKYVHKGTYGYAGKGAKYGNTDYDHEDLEKKDDEGESNQQQKRGRGRPAGAKSGARGPRIK